MTKRKLTIPILLILSLSILSQTLIPSTAAAEPWIYLDPASIVDEPGVLTQITVNVRTNYTGADIWGYQFTLTYNPLILNGFSVTNGPVISTENVTFIPGTFNDTIGKLELTSALSENKTAPQPYPPLNNTGPGILATVVFDVVGDGETPITLVDVDTKLKRGDGSNIVDGYFNPNQLGHGYFRNVPLPLTHDVATTGMSFHLPIVVTTTYNGTLNLTYIDATIENQGGVPEIFDVKIYYLLGSYPTLLKKETVIVSNGTTTTVVASLNVSDITLNYGNSTHPDIRVAVGYLTIVVEASEVYNEAQTNDNSYNTTLLIKMTGDVQGDPGDPDPTIGDGDVDRYDFGTYANHHGKHYPSSGYNSECDFDRNGLIDRVDFGTLAANYGKRITYVPAYPQL